ncbi:mevalonate kinase [Nocardia grenadensis]|uniref:mevalonate kinase n=1 Tax=Nocardia grenadensis TaxID=931537 RepID=UPI003D758814
MPTTRSTHRGVSGSGRAHAKAILIGEHTVVYGLPAVAVPLRDLTVEVVVTPTDTRQRPPPDDGGSDDIFDSRFTASADTETTDDPGSAVVAASLRRWGRPGESVEVRVRSRIPPARGLGSSAATAAATVRAVADLHGVTPDARSLYELVQIGEHVSHGRASGVDAVTVTACRPLRFAAGSIRPITTPADAVLVIADTGAPGRTDRAVAAARTTLHRDRTLARRLLARANELTESAVQELAAGRMSALGQSMNDFHSLLRELSVSTPGIDRLTTSARRAGAYGAKLTGGGLGGCVIALTDADSAAAIGAAMLAAGAQRTWLADIPKG